MENKSDEFSLIALQGPESENILKAIIPNLSQQIQDCPYYGVFESSEAKLIIARTGYTGEDGFEIFCTNEAVKEFWDKILKARCLTVRACF